MRTGTARPSLMLECLVPFCLPCLTRYRSSGTYGMLPFLPRHHPLPCQDAMNLIKPFSRYN